MARRLAAAAARFWRDERGASLVEYAVLLLLLLVVTLGAIAVLGSRLSGFYSAASTSI